MTLLQQLILARHKFQAAKNTMDDASKECENLVRRLEQEFLGGTASHPDLRFIQEAVATYYEISTTILASRLRTEHVYEARMVAFVLCSELTDHAGIRIEACFNAAHGTHAWAKRRHAARLQTDNRYARTYAEIKRTVSERLADLLHKKSA